MSQSQGAVKARVRDSGCNTPALDRALAVLEFVSVRPHGVTQAEIRTGLGMTANLVFRISNALVSHGYLEREPSTKRYRLTSKLLSLAQPRYEDRSLVQLAQEPLRRLRDATGESAHLGVRSGLECIVLERIVGRHPYKCFVEVGTRGPLHTGAPGKAMLAALPEDERHLTVAQMNLQRYTAATITQRADFERHLELVRRRGYAMDLGEGVEGHHCLGAVVRDAEDRPVASVWITAPAARLSERDGKRLSPEVILAAREIEGRLKSGSLA
ncbi:MAG: IclR family transcriptional regulator [Planctomycetota bacterium]